MTKEKSKETKSYLIFARKFRPQTFDEIVGQDAIVATLKNAILQNKIPQSFLFTGTRGVGKTSTARILAKSLNCEKGSTVSPCGKCPSCIEITRGSSLDCIEIDGASNNSVDNIRDLRESISLSPVYGRFKIYIIDEVHMLSMGAFNALLKTLEEPPTHAKFVFATTDVHKVPATILSRCQRFQFRRVPLTEILKKLTEIAKLEKIDADKEALALIAKAAEGSLRDAESMLDQISCFLSGKITTEQVEKTLGLASTAIYIELLKAWGRKDPLGALNILEQALDQGLEMLPFTKGLYEMVRNFLVARVHPEPKQLIDLAHDTIKEIQKETAVFTEDGLLAIMSGLEKLIPVVQYSPAARFALETAVMRFASVADIASIPDLVDRLEKLEKKTNIRIVESAAKASPPETAQVITAPVSTPRSSASKTFIPLDRIEQVWPQVLQTVEKTKMTLALALKQAELISTEDGTLILGFPIELRYHKETLEGPEARILIEKTIETQLGTSVSLKVVLTKPDVAVTGEEKKVSSAPAEIPPIVESALSDIFKGGRIVSRD